MPRHPPVILNIDDGVSRPVLSQILRRAGFAVWEAATGREGLRLAAERPDLVLLDVNLPDLSGFDVCQQIKADPATAAIPVLLISGDFVSSANHVEGLEGGADGYLNKPVAAEELVAQIRALLRLKQAERRRDASYAVTQILAESGPLAAAIPRILQAICEGLDWELGALWVAGPSDHLLHCAGTWQAPSRRPSEFLACLRDQALALGEGFPGRVWAAKRPVWLPDLPSNSSFPHVSPPAREGLHSAFGLPIALDGAVLGVIELFSRAIREPGPDEVPMLTALGSQIGQFLVRRRAEDAVRQSEARKAAVLSSAFDAIITTDQHGTVVEFNPAAERLFGLPREAAIGRPMAELIIPPCLREQYIRAVTEYLSAGHSEFLGRRLEVPARRADGRRFAAELAITAQKAGGAVFFTGFFRDLTELKQAEQRALQAERLAAIGEMVTGLAHESRNALQGIQACLSLLAAKVQDQPEALDLLGRLQQEQDRLHRLHEDVRGYAAHVRLDYQVCDLAGIWRRAWDSLLLSRTGRRAELSEQLDGLDLCCEIDGFRLEQVFRNILDNSLDACADPVQVRIACRETGLSGQPAVQVAVHDNGPGLGAKQAQNLFEPFFTTKCRGTGLGMAISKRLVEAHGGQIAAGNGACPGTEILITLPRRPA